MTRKYKPRRKRVLWRTGQVIEDKAGMRRLRVAVYNRAGGRCEVEWDGKRCNKFVRWDGVGKGELAHIIARGRGGSDTTENTLLACKECHKRKFHPGPQWTIRSGQAEAGGDSQQSAAGADAVHS